MKRFAPGSGKERIYQAICMLLSDRGDDIAWEQLATGDWIEMESMADAEGVAPLLYHKLGELLDKQGFPEGFATHLLDVHGRLAAHYYRCSAQNQLLISELARIIDALSRAGIEPLVLKGAALVILLYPDLALRPMNDLDLLVDRKSMVSAVDAIGSLGYRIEFPEHLGMAKWVDEVVNHHTHLIGGPTKNLAVELHWNLVAGDADWRSPDLDWFWEESAEFNFPRKPVLSPRDGSGYPPVFTARILSPTATLLYQAAHLILQHGEYRSILLWYYDLHRLVVDCQCSIRWDDLAEFARALHWADATRMALMAIQDLFGSPVPESVIDRLEAYSEPRARKIISLNARATEQRTKDTWQGLQVYEWRTRLRLILALVFPRPAYLRWRYHPEPSWLWPLCYPYRWLDLSSDGLASLIRRIGGQPR